jgi:OTU domain-containing protein 3
MYGVTDVFYFWCRYHDWEHFSSIRNLRGPHTGLPNIMETPPQTQDLPSQAEVEKETLKEREREKKRERERKDKERKEERKERSALKVKLKVPSATPEPSAAAAAVPPHPAVQDPSLIPLPTSRSASPFPTAQIPTAPEQAQPLATPARHPLSTSTSSSSSIEAAAAPAHMRSHSRQAHLQASATPGARAQYRSPKRTFDESSASGGDDAEGREGREKRSRTRGASMAADDGLATPAAVGDDMVVDVDGEAEADTPGLSATGSTSSSETSSEVASEVSSLSTSPSPAPEPAVVPAATPKKPARFPHPHAVHGEKALTRRQRKALGLPKQRRAAPPPGVSAGKIVIPGGRWTGRPLPPVAAGGTESEADEEWRRNGTGRLDVRGFRELKI